MYRLGMLLCYSLACLNDQMCRIYMLYITYIHILHIYLHSLNLEQNNMITERKHVCAVCQPCC